MTTPDFFVLGPLKTGSCSLFQSLSQHSAIATPPRKEMCFFCSPDKFPNGYWNYKMEFKQKGQPGLTFDATPHYFADPLARYRICQTLGPVKVICCLRDPVDRLIAHVRVTRAANRIQFDEQLLAQFKKDRPYADNSWAGEPRSIQEIIEDHHQRCHDPLLYFEQGEYIRHLKQWQELMSAQNVHVCIFEELIREPAFELTKIQEFLDIPLEPLKLLQVNPGSQWDDWSDADLSAEFTDQHIRYVTDHYRPYTKSLEKYLGRPLPWQGIPDYL